MGLLIIFFLLSIIVSFLCSIWEAVLLSVTPSYVKTKVMSGDASGELLDELKSDIDKPLSAILSLNTIAHTVGAIGVGAQAGTLYGESTYEVLGIGISMESIIATVMTLAILFLSEIIPKTIGANNWRQLAPVTARSLKVLMIILKPLVWLSTKVTSVMKKDKEASVFGKNEFALMAEVVTETGEIQKEDYQLIRNVLDFDDLTAKDIMTPRPVMVMAEQSQNIKAFYNATSPLIFSRIPIYDTVKDKVTGVILKDELLTALVEGKGEEPLSSIGRKVLFITQAMSLRKVFEMLREEHEHIALVVDEYGGLQGLVTLEDIFETLFGLEIMDETDAVSDLQTYARQKWEERARKMGLIK